MLTQKQHELLMFVSNYIHTTGFSPSFEEMTAALSLKSKSGIHRLITALEERGFLRRRAHRARALEIVRLPTELVLENLEKSTGYEKNTPPIMEVEDSNIAIPSLGRIAAGIPKEVFSDHENSVKVSKYLIGDGKYFAIEVNGDSMIDAGILDGDVAIIEKTSNIVNGSISAVLVDNNEATLKKIRVKGSSIALEPANKRYESRIFNSKRLSFQGKLVGIMRKY